MKKVTAYLAILFLAAFVILAFLEEDKAYTVKTLTFHHNGYSLVGNLIVPKTRQPNYPCIIFVHGAQDITRDAYGYYKPYWQAFSQQGYCSFSWDKPGVGESGGDWHNQSMEGRAREVLAAINFLKQQPEIDSSNLGLIGISQAGWVLPLVTQLTDEVKYIVSISGAINWLDQGNFFVKRKLLSEQELPNNEVEAVLRYRARIDKLLKDQASFADYQSFLRHNPPDFDYSPISPENWTFYKKNIFQDATESIRQINRPVLAIFGENDNYVDIHNSMAVYQAQLSQNKNRPFKIILYNNASHSLINTQKKAFAHQGFALYWNLLKIEILGSNAFPKGYFQNITDWIKQVTKKEAGNTPAS